MGILAANETIKEKDVSDGLSTMRRSATDSTVLVRVINKTGDVQDVSTSPSDRYAKTFLRAQGKIVIGEVTGPEAMTREELIAEEAKHGIRYEEERIGGVIQTKIVREPGSESHRRQANHLEERAMSTRNKPAHKAVVDSAQMMMDGQALAMQQKIAELAATIESMKGSSNGKQESKHGDGTNSGRSGSKKD